MIIVKDTSTRFGLVSVIFHWYVALAVLVLLSTGFVIYLIGSHGALRPLRDDIAYFHISIALTSIPFFLFRIFWRLSNGMPKTHDLHGVVKIAADWVWRLLLLLIVWQMTWGIFLDALHWFEFELFRIRQPVIFEEQATYLENMHRIGGLAIGMLLVLHIGGALKHYFIHRDQLLQNMVRPLVDDTPRSDLS